MLNKGTLYTVGVGPGDPDLLTLKAVKVIRHCKYLILPSKDPERCTAYNIALKALPDISDKPLVCLDIPMTKDKEMLKQAREEGALKIASLLSEGYDAAYLVLGDSTIYASSMYLIELIDKMGYKSVIINGITSFSAAAARLGLSLAEQEEELHILPGNYGIEDELDLDGVKVIMKAGSEYPKIKERLSDGRYDVSMVVNCGMEDEKVYYGAESLPESAPYYSILIVRNFKK